MLLSRVLGKSFFYLCLLPALLAITGRAYGQLQADFTMDKTGGCSPLSVSFTNTTTGASINATYSWDLGNNNSSTLTNPGASYTDEKTYTITLTVKDGAQTSVKTGSVIVYKTPLVAFTGSPMTGCIPLTVNFNSSSMAGDGTISNYFWDFGDGTTQQGAGLAQVGHVYGFSQNTSVSLTVTNSYGCFNTLQTGGIQVLPPVKAIFSADKTTICKVTDAVNFTNSSTGTGVLGYVWDFGDGNNSTEPSPSHVYAAKGNYTVKMTVTNAGGCTDTQSLVLNVATMTVDFSVPTLACKDNIAQFTDQSSPTPTSNSWQVDGAYSSNGPSLNYTFSTPGNHTVQLTDAFGGCSLSVTKSVTVKDNPNLQGFVSTMSGGACGAPATVQFKDTTESAVKWAWDFADQGSSSSIQAPSHTYNANGNYYVDLTVTDAQGCTAQASQLVSVQPPVASVYLVNSSDPDGSPVCKPVTATFAASSSAVLSTYQWDFGDGGTSTDPKPTHVFSTPGTFIIHLTYTTTGGCTGTSEYSSIHVYEKPVAAFTSSPASPVCGNNPVTFNNESTGPIIGQSWDFTNGTADLNSGDADPVIRFSDSGTYTVKLIVYNESCSDTLIKTDYIKVLPPFPKISSQILTCDGNRGFVKFVQTSRMAQGWNWDFGDGSTDAFTTETDTVSHTYAQTGVYKVVLTTTNGQCATRDSVKAYVLLQQYPVLSSAQTTVCSSSPLNVSISGLEQPPNRALYPNDYTIIGFRYGDGNSSTASVTTPYPYNWINYNNGSVTLSNLAAGEKDLRVIIASNQGCNDTSNFIPLTIAGPLPGFEVTTPASCYTSPVNLKDTSASTGQVAIINWQWDYGDGHSATFAMGGTVSHTYPGPGYYYPVLTVTDAGGCSASTSANTQVVQVNGPKASFTYSPSAVSPGTNVSFNNTTDNTGDNNTLYQWSFGDGAGSTDTGPQHSYGQIGTDTVTLVAADASAGCSDTSIQVLYVKNLQLSFTTNESYINNNNCPPVVVEFSNTSINTASVSWDFGDGSTAGNQDHTSHVYSQPGVYLVTLHGYGTNGLTDSVTDSITIKGPYALLQADTLAGCPSQKVSLTARVRNASSYTWDFADGTLLQTNDTFAVHQYLAAGIYTPSLILKDSNGCSGTSKLAQPVIIHPQPAIAFLPAAPAVCLGGSIQLKVTGGQSYQWSPSTGLDNTAEATPIASPTVTTQYQVKATNEYGCTNTDSLSVIVARPFTLTAPADTFVCLGSRITLPVSGAASYNWISGAGLSDTTVSDPSAAPVSNSEYIVVGYDGYQCFTDTTTIRVSIEPLPTVNIGPDAEILTGSSLTLTTTASPDVTQWNWLPPDYLSCSDCASPVSEPRSAITYIATVKNKYGCAASDTMSVKLICAEGRVYIPNSFTPNHDGKNDVFYIEARGIRLVRSLRIYDRWGEPVFETRNSVPNDRSAGWNGSVKGHAAVTGTYVYFAELECDTGEVFPMKGTVTLVK